MERVPDVRTPTLGLYIKLTLVMVPSFLVLAALGLAWMGDRVRLQTEEEMARRIGGATARVGTALERRGEWGAVALDPGDPVVTDFLRTLLSDGAIRCVELVDDSTGEIRVAVPQGLGCRNARVDADLFVPLELASPGHLVVRYERSELEEAKRDWRDFVLALLSAGLVIAALANWVSFRVIVGRPLRRLIYGIEHARGIAEAANRAKSDFLNRVSHELRTPIHGILGMTDLLAESDQSREQVTCTRSIAQSGEALLAIVNDLLDVAKIEAGRLTLSETAFDPRDLSENVVTLLAPLAERKGVEIFAAIDPELPALIRTDRDRLRQVLVNLLGNAIKFTEAGHVRLEVAVMTPGEVAFAVADTGIGLSSDKIGTVFGVFEQADDDPARRAAGTGLGLAICEQLATLMGGRIEVASTFGVGSTFTLSLPLDPDLEAPTPPVILPPGRILLVDPLAPRRAAMAAELRRAGAEIVEAADWPVSPGAELVLADAAAGPPPTGLSARVLSLGFGGGGAGGAGALRKPVGRDALFEAVRSAANATSEAPARPVAATGWASGLEVLVVDDHAMNRLLLEKYFATSGARLRSATTGREALEQYAVAAADLVLMDFRMPVMDGLESARAIRALERDYGLARARIAMLTGETREIFAGLEAPLPFDDILTKPVRKAELMAYVGRMGPAGIAPAPV